jgi:uncharacterized protein (DUF1330 family)
MKKAYWIARSKIIDPVAYGEYARLAGEAGAKLFGGEARILARGGDFMTIEGSASFERHVLIEFPSLDAALDFHASPEYRKAASFRAGAGINELVIVEGVDDAKQE